MGNIHAGLIIAALFVVLLSAFGADRFHVCHGSRLCLKQTAGSWLPGARWVSERTAPHTAVHNKTRYETK